jgi:hypothetical protein
MGAECSMRGDDGKYIIDFGSETCREETIRKTEA